MSRRLHVGLASASAEWHYLRRENSTAAEKSVCAPVTFPQTILLVQAFLPDLHQALQPRIAVAIWMVVLFDLHP